MIFSHSSYHTLSLLLLARPVSGSWWHGRLHTCVWLKLCFGTCSPHLTDSSNVCRCEGVWKEASLWVCVSLSLFLNRLCIYTQMCYQSHICVCPQWVTAASSDVKRWAEWQQLHSRRPFDNNSLCWPFSWLKSFSSPVTWTVYYPQRPFNGTMQAWRSAVARGGGGFASRVCLLLLLNQLDLPRKMPRFSRSHSGGCYCGQQDLCVYVCVRVSASL